MYTTMSNFPYLPHYLLPTSMIIISCVNFFDLSILTFQCSTISCQKWFFRGISWQRCCHCYPFCAALVVRAIKTSANPIHAFSWPEIVVPIYAAELIKYYTLFFKNIVSFKILVNTCLACLTLTVLLVNTIIIHGMY